MTRPAAITFSRSPTNPLTLRFKWPPIGPIGPKNIPSSPSRTAWRKTIGPAGRLLRDLSEAVLRRGLPPPPPPHKPTRSAAFPILPSFPTPRKHQQHPPPHR